VRGQDRDDRASTNVSRLAGLDAQRDLPQVYQRIMRSLRKTLGPWQGTGSDEQASVRQGDDGGLMKTADVSFQSPHQMEALPRVLGGCCSDLLGQFGDPL
jgi:hypothetical protein